MKKWLLFSVFITVVLQPDSLNSSTAIPSKSVVAVSKGSAKPKQTVKEGRMMFPAVLISM